MEPLRLLDLTRRLETVDAELRALLIRRLSRVVQRRASESGGRGLFGKAGYDPNEARDARGRWTNSGPGTAPAHQGRLLGHLARHPFVPAVYRPGKDRPIFTSTAGGEEEREDLEEDFRDPTEELRTELFNLAYRELKAIDPVNPAFEMLTPVPWVPSWRDVQDLNDTLEAAKATRDMELNGEPPPDIWELGWGARGVAAERMRGMSLPQNFPTIDRFANGIAISIKSIDLDSPSYQEPWQLEARINYYVNRLAAFNGSNWARFEIQPQQIRGRTLDLIVPRGSLSPEREATILRCRIRAGYLGVGIVTVQY
jgi:hypothetical protein